MNFDSPELLTVGVGTQVDHCGREGNKREEEESWGGARVLMIKTG